MSIYVGEDLEPNNVNLNKLKKCLIQSKKV